MKEDNEFDEFSSSFGLVVEDQRVSPDMALGDIVICDPGANISAGDIILANLIEVDHQHEGLEVGKNQSNSKVGSESLIPIRIVGRIVKHIREI